MVPLTSALVRPQLGTREMQAGGALYGEGSGSRVGGMIRTRDVLA